MRPLILWVCCWPFTTSLLGAETGLMSEVTVREPTRLDWQAVAAPFGDVRLPGDYDSRRQKYQLFVPPRYDEQQAWPLLVFSTTKMLRST